MLNQQDSRQKICSAKERKKQFKNRKTKKVCEQMINEETFDREIPCQKFRESENF